MSFEGGIYNIKAVSTKLGIQPGTLRAWERRYKIIEPVRNQAGHRLYTEKQVSILKWLITKVNSGFTISQAVDLLEKQDIEHISSNFEINNDQVINIKDELLNSLLKFEENQANQLLDKAFSLYTIENVVIHIIGELLIEIGDMWEKQEITVAHEHYITSYLRTKIGMIFHHLPVNGFLPKVICTCPPKELHETGLLIFTLFLKRKGYETIYLGSGIPKSDLESVVKEVNPTILFFSATLSESLQESYELASKFSNQFNTLTIGIGGQALAHLSSREKANYKQFIVGKNEEEWSHWLKSFHENNRS
ncbi:MerR family transcriptional regulator [Evansella sp. AB-P1]|uniref:MerR family transcriptional regulator n=1 Tax=Evansella sp. AB-P1 TaxID=3037653 RepID=UPI00241CE802|nr:MerR family transcriptional regulator [Evansella sp. AB-P1]MDG5787629.1 MerR family transcriptional regulator [Evansella sp. AB-P1]